MVGPPPVCAEHAVAARAHLGGDVVEPLPAAEPGTEQQ